MPRTFMETALTGDGPRDALTGVYLLDPLKTTIGFSVRRAMVAHVRGRFTDLEGLLQLDGRRPTRSRAFLTVRTGSLRTGLPERDARLTGPGYLDTATFPLMGFRSTGIVHIGEDRFRMSGSLRIKDVDLPLHIDLASGRVRRDSYGTYRVGFKGTAVLRRSDWGLNWNTPPSARDVLVGDTVKLVFDISAVRPGQPDLP
ncbi:YceI family protein [Streptomyces sp. NPDC002574]|uniref:YceI family protein n=1 Tax=Streptomyces sp. NPDC002574 TaxID=3364652 RepID=UPI00368C01FE